MSQELHRRPKNPRKPIYMTTYVLAIVVLLPQVKALGFYNYLWMTLSIIWIASLLTSQARFLQKPSSHQLVTCLFVIYTVSMSYIFGNSNIGNRYLELSTMFIFYWTFVLGIKYDNNYYNKKIIYWLMPFITYTSAKTISMYVDQPLVSRAVKPGTDEGVTLLAQGVGGYDFVYFLLFFVGTASYLVDRASLLGARRFAAVSLLILFSLNILLSNFMTAALLFAMGMIFRFFVRKPSVSSISLMVIGFILISNGVGILIPPVIAAMQFFSPDSLNAVRLNEIKFLLESGIVERSMGARFDAYLSSVDAFYSAPLFGIIVNDLNSDEGSLIGFGQHSLFIDTFGLFGFIGGALLSYMVIKPLLMIVKVPSGSAKSAAVLLLLTCLIFFLANNASPLIGLGIFFICPALIFEVSRRSQIGAHAKKHELPA